MEEIEGDNDDIPQLPQRKVSVKATEIISKFKSIKDRQGFCREMSILKFIIFRFIFSSRNRIRFNILFAVFEG